MKINPLEQEEPAFQMAPMIDMVFLLLVFFMCASHLSQTQSIKLEVPTASKAVVPKERPDRWVVNIQKSGAVYSGNAGITVENLALEVKARLKAQPKLKVYLRADANAAHKEVKKVMNALAEVGIDDFIFGVYIPTDKPGGAQ
ncbi:MAG: biopolymer transporter ExbD [Lentisphaerae bacterium]|jgi:biopolymer transport protein ExbD|nr:biopolymer transporter ExbD [Lentisphaerota bacterium]MBT4818044.1 biopolymer transporter ExbD [Lentisphaerota bacterium]MBT5605014.1 biopolymer transporter ExbD [Lentisphaerota bacterium]MBT7054644.1 biopolymer transporter ExbD [Lentisphaerota bacterium]MBT7844673.1 biopolymer transporter ExbD [Lentisphaerota bacterium]